ncbi:conserved hypothetical protein [Coccidioides posadasii str. Silveira]|uniref:Uncharacterized protein n=1 Tax=Coccidioides posadasii (strain RMSCC 757 / Silveira) TaxID=443226 RepID=E9D582_COCPS|nr:conserved hypothetical protein [Coccidioides posadasii str. Silveira]
MTPCLTTRKAPVPGACPSAIYALRLGMDLDHGRSALGAFRWSPSSRQTKQPSESSLPTADQLEPLLAATIRPGHRVTRAQRLRPGDPSERHNRNRSIK